jgi:hypothetical protein
MPKENTPARKESAPHHHISVEANAYLDGLFQELRRQKAQYLELTQALHSIEARIELAEKTLSLTRDHLSMTISQTDHATPRDWSQVFQDIRFVGVRLADACMALLQEQKKMTPEELLGALNEGMFRFRTNSPQREIHAAMLRQSFAKKSGEQWVWIGKTGQQISMRLRSAAKPTNGLASQETSGE